MTMKRLIVFSMLSLAVFASCSKDNSLKIVEDVCVQMKDDAFASYCRSEFDTDKDGKVSMKEASLAEIIDIKEKGISSLKGLNYFFNLKTLDCSQNDLSTLDISGNPSLNRLYCSKNKLKSLNLSKNTRLLYLSASDNDITSLDLSNNRKLSLLICSGNRLSSLDISMLHWLSRSYYVEMFGSQKEGTITITDSKKNWSSFPSDVEEAGIKWNWK